MTASLVPNTATRAFEYIAERTCKVITPHGEATGCLIGDKVVATVMHIFSVTESGSINPEGLEIRYKDRQYTATLMRMNVETASRADAVLLQIQQEVSLPFFETVFEGDLPNGTDVYFSGFPLSQSNLTHHKGMVSSVVDNGARFTIDGTIVRGNSGGPVVAESSSGGFVLVGMITREVAMLPSSFTRHYKGLSKIDIEPVPRGKGKWKKDYCSIDGAHFTDDEDNVARLNAHPEERIIILLRAAMDNISTGIGKALHARCLLPLYRGEELPELLPDTVDFPVGKKSRLRLRLE